MSDTQAVQGPKRIWRLNQGTGGCDAYRLGYYSPLSWEFSDGCLGSHGRTPWTAVFRWWRWRREYRNAPPGTWATD